jgi:hypothetical protein
MKKITWFLKRTSVVLTMVVLGLLLLAAGAVAAIWIKPELVLNERMLGIVANELRASGTDLRWGKVHVNVERQAWHTKRFGFAFDRLCVEQAQPDVRGCLERVELGTVVSFAGARFRLPEIGPIALLGGRVSADFSKPPATKPEEKKSDVVEAKGDQWPAFLRDTQFRPVTVAIDAVDVTLPGRRLRGELSLKAERDGDKLRVDLKSAARQLTGKLKTHADLAVAGDVSARGLHARINLKATDLIEQLPWIGLRDCAIDLESNSLRTHCPIAAGLPVPPSRFAPLQFPTEVGALLLTDLKTGAFPPSPASRLSGDVSLKVTPVLKPLLQGRAEVKSRIDGVPANFPRDWKLDTDLDLAVGVKRFEDLVARLSRTPWAVPAPLAVLKGSIELSAKGRIDAQKGELPVQLTTRLASASQSLTFDGKGVLRAQQVLEAPRAHLDFDLALSRVQLELPRLGLENPPRLFRDRRFTAQEIAQRKAAPTTPQAAMPRQQAGVKPPTEPTSIVASGGAGGPGSGAPGAAPGDSPFTYRIRVFTPGDSPVKILSNLAKAPVPIHVDIVAESGADIQGGVRVTEFPVEFFRRKAVVDHFSLKLATPAEDSPIDGKIEVPYADYTVRVAIISTVGKPRVILTSDPPLPQDQLVATLLFGHPIEDLEADERESVGDANAAVRDGALGLASLYALASTPVQSVGYDPSTGVVSAKVRVADGTSVTVGSAGSALDEVGLRRRLTRRWAIRTTVENPTNRDNVSASTFLEWSYQY